MIFLGSDFILLLGPYGRLDSVLFDDGRNYMLLDDYTNVIFILL